MSVFPAESQILSNRPVKVEESSSADSSSSNQLSTSTENVSSSTPESTPAAPQAEQAQQQQPAPQQPQTAPAPSAPAPQGSEQPSEQKTQAPTPDSATPTPPAPKPEPEVAAKMEEAPASQPAPVAPAAEQTTPSPAPAVQKTEEKETAKPVNAFKQNYGDIDQATNDLLLPKKNVQLAQDRFITTLEKDTARVGIKFIQQEPFFSSPLDNSADASILLVFRDIPLVKVNFHAKGKDLQDIHAKRSGAYTASSYPVEISFSPRLARELAYDLNLDLEKDIHGVKALVRPFKHLAEAQPYRFAFNEDGNINQDESQEDRLRNHFVMMASQLVFAASQLGIAKRKPTFVDPNENSEFFE